MANPGLNKLDQLCVDTIRFLAVDGVEKAKSGHPGMPMGMAPAAYVLWTRHLRHNPANPQWHNRDRFVLSGGHGSMLLYSLLHLTGYGISLDDLKQFRQWNSKTPGHPEYHPELGIEATTGPLGQGISNAVGMAIAQKYLASHFNREGFPIIDYKVYVFCGDGDLEEGISSETCSLAGHLGLDNLVVIYDDNHISIDGVTDLSFTEDRAKRFQAYNWHVQKVEGDGNNMKKFERALINAKSEVERPSLIQLRTHIAYGAPTLQDTAKAHGSPLGEAEIKATKEKFGWDPNVQFHVPEKALEHMRKAVEQGAEAEKQWNDLFEQYAQKYPELAQGIPRRRRGPAAGEAGHDPAEIRGRRQAARHARGLRQSARRDHAQDADDPGRLGGPDPVEQHAVRRRGGLPEGLPPRPLYPLRRPRARHGRDHERHQRLSPACGLTAGPSWSSPTTCEARSAWRPCRTTRRSSSGRTTASAWARTARPISPSSTSRRLRAIPDLLVIRPADANETAQAWKYILEHPDRPVGLLLSRQGMPVIDQNRYASASNLSRGRVRPDQSGRSAGDPDGHRLGSPDRYGGCDQARRRGHCLAGREHALLEAVREAG